MARILNSPNQNVAGEQVVLLQTAITEIKRLIISGASQKQIQAVINNYCSKFTNEQTQAVFRRNLIQSTNKMLYEYNHNMKIINQSFINQVIKAFAIGTGTTLSNNTYTIDLTAIYREYLNDEIDQRKVITEFRNHITNAKKGLALIKDYDRKVIEQTKLLASEPVKYIAKDGRAISIRNKVEMSVRYEANMKDLEQYKSLGIKLVWTSSHADASPRCSPFQGKLWSLDGTSGTIDGIKYQPIEIALNANGGNSIINGYNCRHYLIEYEKGSVAPRHFTSKEIQKEYRIDQRQRIYENEIRHKKTMETLLRQQGFKEEASKMREQWQNLNKRYEEYSIKNGRAFYRWRTLISDEERQKNIERLDSKNKDDIIEVDEKQVDKLFSNIPDFEDNKTKIINDLKNSKHKDVVNVYNRYSNQLSYKHTNRRPYYSSSEQKIYINKLKESYKEGNLIYQKPGQVIWHETGHMIANKIAIDKGFSMFDDISSKYRSKKYTETSYLHPVDSKGNVEEKIVVRGYTMGGMLKKEWSDIFENKKEELKNEATNKGLKKSTVRNSDVYATLKKEILEDSKKNQPKNKTNEAYTGILIRTDISDIIEGLTGARIQLGVGHGASYWKTIGVEQEAFAELYSAKMCNEESYQFIKKYFPKTVDIFEEILQDIPKKEEKND